MSNVSVSKWIKSTEFPYRIQLPDSEVDRLEFANYLLPIKPINAGDYVFHSIALTLFQVRDQRSSGAQTASFLKSPNRKFSRLFCPLVTGRKFTVVAATNYVGFGVTLSRTKNDLFATQSPVKLFIIAKEFSLSAVFRSQWTLADCYLA